MQSLELPNWNILFDREATVAAYARIPRGGAESCRCDPCRNWVESRGQILPRELRDLLERLGIPPDRDAEVYHDGRLDSGLHSYGGWYHFVGRVVRGEREDAPLLEFGFFRVFFHSSPGLVPEAFAGQPVVQLEFMAEVPWLSRIAEAP